MKNMKKRVLAALLCVVTVFGLTACGGSKTEEKSALDKVKEAGVLKVSVSPDFAPYEFEDPTKKGQDSYVGADMELARYIADKLGVKLEIVPMEFDACLAGVVQDKVDVSISGLYPSEERKKTVDFTDPYFDDSTQLLVIKKDNVDKYKKTEDFDGQVVAAQNGSAQYSIVQEQMPNAKLQAVSKTTDGVQMVKSDKVAGILLQAVMAQSVVASDDTLAVSEAEYKYDESQLVIAVKKGETQFVDELNKIIAEVSKDKLYDKWIVEAQELAAKVTTD